MIIFLSKIPLEQILLLFRYLKANRVCDSSIVTRKGLIKKVGGRFLQAPIVVRRKREKFEGKKKKQRKRSLKKEGKRVLNKLMRVVVVKP